MNKSGVIWPVPEIVSENIKIKFDLIMVNCRKNMTLLYY